METTTVALGASASLSRTFTADDVKQFADLVGDHNPLHLDPSFARQSRFGRNIVHGMLPASLISAVIGQHLPGPGSVYLSQMLKFVAPVYPGDRITARVTVIGIREDKPIVTLETICERDDGQEVLRGEAVVLVSRTGPSPAGPATT